MIRAVLDTNVYISELFWKGPPYEVLQKGLGGAFLILISFSIIKELQEKLIDKFRFPPTSTHVFLEIIAINAEVIEPAIKLNAVKADPTDNKIIECALEGNAHYIVSGDRHLLDIKTYRGIKIVNPSQFLEQLSL